MTTHFLSAASALPAHTSPHIIDEDWDIAWIKLEYELKTLGLIDFCES